GQPLGTGVDAGQGVSSPWPQARGVGEATPQIDDELAFHPDRNRGADVVTVGEVRGEGVAHPLEAGSARTVDGDPGRVEQGSSCRSCPRSERATESHPRGSLQLSTVAEQLPARSERHTPVTRSRLVSSNFGESIAYTQQRLRMLLGGVLGRHGCGATRARIATAWFHRK